MGCSRLACQTITFGPEQRHDFSRVFRSVAQAGYDGVEIGFRHLAAIPPATLTQGLADEGLVLAASHLGGNLEGPDQAAGERQILDGVIAYLKEAGVDLLMYSGLRFSTPEQFAADLAMLHRSADRCAAEGIRLLYHNHNWEFADGARVMNALVAHTDSALGFCPDLGWVHKGGVDVLAFLDSVAERIGGLHFKDFASTESGVDTVVLGTGVAPLAGAAAWARTHVPDLWMIAEQDTADGAPEDAVAANAQFLRSVFG